MQQNTVLNVLDMGDFNDQLAKEFSPTAPLSGRKF